MRVTHYINQFFGQVGGETEAHHPLEVREGTVGPGMMLSQMLGDDFEIVNTIVCGDNYFVENEEKLTPEIVKILKDSQTDLLIAGPAFNAGRYGMACGMVCKIACEELNLPAISGMYKENPGLELYRKYAYIVPVENSARKMKEAIDQMATLAKKIEAGEELNNPEKDGFVQRGIRKNYFLEETGAKRSVDMLIKKIAGEEFETELPMPVFEKYPPSKPIENIGDATIAILTSGGMVPKGNPDHLEACNCTKFRRYNIKTNYGDLERISGEVVHGGYDPTYGNDDANRILPVDVLKEFENEKKIGSLYEDTFVTVGNGMGTDQAAIFGDEIAKELLGAKIDGAILTST